MSAVMRATGVTPEQREADLDRRKRNARMKAGCAVTHTPEQQAERDENIQALTRVWGEKVASLLDLKSATCEQLRRWGAAAKREEEKIAALRAAATAPLKLRTATPEDEAAELRTLAIELYGRADIHVFTDQNGVADPYKSESNKRSATEAARLVRDQRERFEARTAPLRAHMAEHRAAAQEVGLFGSVALQLAKNKLRDESGKGIYGQRGMKSREPLPLRDGTPDPYAKAIEIKQAKRAAEQAAHDKKWG